MRRARGVLQRSRRGLELDRGGGQRLHHAADHGLKTGGDLREPLGPAHRLRRLLRGGDVRCLFGDQRLLEDLDLVGDLADFGGFVPMRDRDREVAFGERLHRPDHRVDAPGDAAHQDHGDAEAECDGGDQHAEQHPRRRRIHIIGPRACRCSAVIAQRHQFYQCRIQRATGWGRPFDVDRDRLLELALAGQRDDLGGGATVVAPQLDDVVDQRAFVGRLDQRLVLRRRLVEDPDAFGEQLVHVGARLGIGEQQVVAQDGAVARRLGAQLAEPAYAGQPAGLDLLGGAVDRVHLDIGEQSHQRHRRNQAGDDDGDPGPDRSAADRYPR